MTERLESSAPADPEPFAHHESDTSVDSDDPVDHAIGTFSGHDESDTSVDSVDPVDHAIGTFSGHDTSDTSVDSDDPVDHAIGTFSGHDTSDDSDDSDVPVDHEAELDALAARLGCATTDRDLLRQAVSHRSWCAEHGGVPSNERLEFLGDSVLGIIVTDFTYRVYPDLDESELSRLRAAVVSAGALADAAGALDLGAALLLGKGEAATGGRTKTSILADGLEAVIGAVYIDQGWDAASLLVLTLLGDRIADAARGPGEQDYKSMLQELAAQRGDSPPTYALSAVGPDHRKTFSASVSVAGAAMGEGEGSTKKAAEQAAAEAALDALRTATHPEGR